MVPEGLGDARKPQEEAAEAGEEGHNEARSGEGIVHHHEDDKEKEGESAEAKGHEAREFEVDGLRWFGSQEGEGPPDEVLVTEPVVEGSE